MITGAKEIKKPEQSLLNLSTYYSNSYDTTRNSHTYGIRDDPEKQPMPQKGHKDRVLTLEKPLFLEKKSL